MTRRWCAVLAALLPARAVAEAPCTEYISGAAAQGVFDRLAAARPSGCVLEGVSTQATRMEIRWRAGDEVLAPVVVAPAGCAGRTGATGPWLEAAIPDVVRQRCPEAEALMLSAVGAAPQAPPPAPKPPEAPRGPRRIYYAVAAIFVLALALAAWVLARAWRRRAGPPGAWSALAAGSFALVVLAGSFVEPSAANWYANLLPPSGPPDFMTFGPGAYLWHGALRLALPWNNATLHAAQLLLWALATAVFVGVLREKRVAFPAAVAACVLLALSPIHLRIARSSSEHVLSATLQLGVLLAWLRWLRTGERAAAALALLLVPAATATRPDAFAQLLVVPLFGLLPDRAAGHEGWRSKGVWKATALFGLVWAATGVAARLTVVNHPLPLLEDHVAAVAELFRQFYEAATFEPGWYPPVAALLAVPGAVWMAVKRPALLVAVAATLILGFVPLGRIISRDGLVGTRYFLFVLALTLLPAAYALDALVAAARRLPGTRRAPAAAAAVLLAGLALAVALPARDAYAWTYAYQEEQAFLARALRELPPDCRVYALPMRVQGFGRDLDCCLDVRRSGVPLDFPRMTFLELESGTPPPGEGCAAQYRGSACSLPEAGDPRDVYAKAWFQRRCAELAAVPGTTTAAAELSARSPTGQFKGLSSLRVELKRVR